MRIVDRIRIKALVIAAEDDPFVPSRPFHDPKVTRNSCIDVRVCDHGGHCGFVGPRSGEDDGYWAENQIVDFFETTNAETAELAEPNKYSRRAPRALR